MNAAILIGLGMIMAIALGKLVAIYLGLPGRYDVEDEE